MVSVTSDPEGVCSSVITVEQLEEVILAQLPPNVQDQLKADEWNEVISAAVRSLNSYSGKSGSQSSSEDADYQAPRKIPGEGLDQLELDDGVSVVSNLTEAASNLPGENVLMVAKMDTLHIDLVEESKSSSYGSARVLPKKSRNSSGRNVEFGKVLIRTYERVLEMNPSTSAGPSVGLGWDYEQEFPLTLDAHQAARRYSKKGEKCPVLRRETRELLLSKLGYSQREMAKAVRECRRIKNQRKQTYTNLHHERIEYMVEKSKRKVGRLLRPLKIF